MATSNLKMNDKPPSSALPYEDDFMPDQSLIDEISNQLQVNPEWVKQGIYLTGSSTMPDEVRAWVLENHPRFELVPSSGSSDDEMDIPESKFALAFIVNKSAQLKGSALCHQVSQATLEFYDGNKDHDEVKAWMAERAVKLFYQVNDGDELYRWKGLAEADDLLCHQVYGMSADNKSGIGAIEMVTAFGELTAVQSLVQKLEKL